MSNHKKETFRHIEERKQRGGAVRPDCAKGGWRGASRLYRKNSPQAGRMRDLLRQHAS